MKRLIGLAALTVLDLPPAEQVRVAAQAGYDCVGLRLIPPAGDGRTGLISGDTAAVREAEARLRDTGLKVLDVEIFRLDPQVQVPAFEPFLETGARLGATQLVVACADPQEARLAANFAALCELSARYGLTPNIEPMPWLAVDTVAKANRILGLSGQADAGVLIDPIHFFRQQNRLDELSGTPVRYLQFCDARRETPIKTQEFIRQAREDRLMPGEGDLDLRGLLAALPPGLPLSLEIPYAKPMTPFERAALALRKTRALLES